MIFKLIVFAYPYGQPQAVSEWLKFIICLVQTSVLERMYFRRVIIEWTLLKFRKTCSQSRQINLKIKLLLNESFLFTTRILNFSWKKMCLISSLLGSALKGTNIINFFFTHWATFCFLSTRIIVWLFSSTAAHLPCLHCKFQEYWHLYLVCHILHVNKFIMTGQQ